MSSGGYALLGDDPSRAARVIVISAVVAMAAASAWRVLDGGGDKQARRKKRVRDAFDWDAFLDDLTPTECKRLFRMSRRCINELHLRIAHHLDNGQPEMGERGCGHSLSTMQRLLAALAYVRLV